MLTNKTVVVAVCGSISAYKACDLVSQLGKLNCTVRVAMTEAACKIIPELPLEVLSGAHVVTGISPEDCETVDVWLAEADAVVVAPASANTIAYVAMGEAPSAAAYAVLNATCPVMVAPAMNVNMYRNVATQENLEMLRSRGYIVIPPVSGHLACGDDGEGKLPSIPELIDWICREIACEKDLAGKSILVSAGPTREAIDPVRFITNHSTGTMGYAIARRAMLRGADVTLVSGPVSLTPPPFVNVVDITSAQDMFEAVSSRADDQDAVIMAAAIADYRPADVKGDKIKKADGAFDIDFERTPDTLAWLGAHRNGRTLLCGFSMETRDVIENSRSKLQRKNVDMIAANSLREPGAGFGTPTNHLTFITAEGEIDLPLLSKGEAADRLLDELFKLTPKNA